MEILRLTNSFREPFCILISNIQVSSFSTSSWILFIFWYYHHSSGYEEVSCYIFDLYFSNDYWCWVSFLCLLTICIFSLEKWLSKSFVHFLIEFIVLLLSCKCSLNILDTGPFSDIWLANMWFENIFYLLQVLFVFLVIFFDTHSFYFDMFQFIYFFVVVLLYTCLCHNLMIF